MNQTANHLNTRFPVGLMTDVSMLVANPAYGTIPNYAANWTTGAYHGTVVWGWPLVVIFRFYIYWFQAMMASGLEKQLLRCHGTANIPAFCNDTSVYGNIISAYNNLWNSIEANTNSLRTEVWSWVYNNGFQYTPLGDLPAPGGAAQTESDIVQVFLLEDCECWWCSCGVWLWTLQCCEIRRWRGNCLRWLKWYLVRLGKSRWKFTFRWDWSELVSLEVAHHRPCPCHQIHGPSEWCALNQFPRRISLGWELQIWKGERLGVSGSGQEDTKKERTISKEGHPSQLVY